MAHPRSAWFTRETAVVGALGVLLGAAAAALWISPASSGLATPAPPSAVESRRAGSAGAAGPTGSTASRPSLSVRSDDASPEATLQRQGNPPPARPPSGIARRRPPAEATSDASRYAAAAGEPGLSSDTRAAIYVAGAWRSYREGQVASAQRLLESAYALRSDLELEPAQYDAGFRKLAANARAAGRVPAATTSHLPPAT